MNKRLIELIVILGLIVLPSLSNGESMSDYLILQDIGIYKLSQPQKLIPGVAPVGGPRVGENAGAVSGTHLRDHVDKTYEVMYLDMEIMLPRPSKLLNMQALIQIDG